MHFEDLELCRYHGGGLDAAAWAVPLLAVGWLESPHHFEVGAAAADLVCRIGELVEQTRERFPHYVFRGFYECSLCRALGRSTGGGGWSQENLIVPGKHEVYAAPGAIVHYVSDHSYRPPAAFVEAVASCPDCGTEEYFEALRRANSGQEPPLEAYETYSLRLRASMERAMAFKQALGVPLMEATRSQVVAAARTIWPNTTFPSEAKSIELDDTTVTFDDLGRVLECGPRNR